VSVNSDAPILGSHLKDPALKEMLIRGEATFYSLLNHVEKPKFRDSVEEVELSTSDRSSS